ncbi:MAG: GNAT family N-acetyltransferase [Acidobacteria bacterium]|nr:MAG: GNAT family N-acetyltransferase [Acidobacteriota bacterium]
MRTLMIGCAAGEGHLADESIVEELASALPHIAKKLRAPLIVMKEFPARYRPALETLRRRGFTRVPSMPMTRLNIMYDNFDDFLAQKLSKPTRKSLRRKLRAADRADPPIELQVVTDVSPFIDEIYPLYLAVYERSPLHFEKLTKEFLCTLGMRMPDKVRFFIWRQAGRAIAFSLCMIHNDTIYDEYLGLDYAVAFDLNLYFYTLRDIINWAITHGIQWHVSSALNYEPKLHLRCDLAPLDLYVAHTSPIVNAFMKRLLPLLEPTRNDPVLRRFPNFREVWG